MLSLQRTKFLLENLFMSHVMRKTVYAICDNKGADQPAHPHSLISAYVVCFLDSIIIITLSLFSEGNIDSMIRILAKFKLSRL